MMNLFRQTPTVRVCPTILMNCDLQCPVAKILTHCCQVAWCWPELPGQDATRERTRNVHHWPNNLIPAGSSSINFDTLTNIRHNRYNLRLNPATNNLQWLVI